jgi:hypothetical protein
MLLLLFAYTSVIVIVIVVVVAVAYRWAELSRPGRGSLIYKTNEAAVAVGPLTRVSTLFSKLTLMRWQRAGRAGLRNMYYLTVEAKRDAAHPSRPATASSLYKALPCHVRRKANVEPSQAES